MKRVNEQDKNTMLDGMLAAGGQYNLKLFGQTIPTGFSAAMLGGALGAIIGGLVKDEFGSSRIHGAYIGFTNDGFNVAVLDDWDISKLALTRTYRFSDITKIKVYDKMLAVQANIWIGKKKFMLSFPKKLKSDIVNQKECALQVAEIFNKIADELKAKKSA